MSAPTFGAKGNKIIFYAKPLNMLFLPQSKNNINYLNSLIHIPFPNQLFNYDY